MSSSIRMIYDINNQSWSFQENDLTPLVFTTLDFSFISKDTMTTYKDLNFGVSVYHKESIILSEDFPKKDKIYECSDSYPLESVSIDLLAEENYTLKVWASNAGIRTEGQYIFSTPRTAQPFSSWVWDEGTKEWNPPIPAPEGHFRWKDDTREWIPVLPGETVW